MEFGRWIVFFLLNLALFFSWFGVLDRHKHSVSSRLMMAFILSAGQIILTTFLLGLPWAKLTAVNLVALNAGISGALFVFIAVRKEMLNSLKDLGQAVWGVLKIINSETVPKILALLTAVTIIWIIFIAVIYPPIEWDSLMYHLPSIGHYIQQQSLADPALPMGLIEESWLDSSIWVNSFPKNIELLFLWATIIPGHDQLVDLVELAFSVLGMIAVYSLANELGAIKKWSISAGFLFFLTPIVIAQSRSNYIDLAISALVLAIFALLYKSNSKRSFSHVIVAGIAAGIVLGAKWSGLLFLPILLAMLMGQRIHWNLRSGLQRFSKVVYESALFLGPAVLFGAYYYVKNWYLYTNPLWPFNISFLGRDIFSGLITQNEVTSWTFPAQFRNQYMVQMLWTSWRETGISDYVHDIRPGGLGPFWFVIGLPAIFFAVRWIIQRRDWAQALIFIAAIAMLILHPSNWWTRFTMYIAGLGTVAFAMVRSAEYRHEVTRLIDIMLVIMIVWTTGASLAINDYQPNKIAGLLKKPPEMRTSAAIRPYIVSKAYDYINKETIDRPANIAYGSGLDFTYPLWGPRFKNRVYYLEPTNFPNWIKKLREKQIKYLLVRTNTPEHKLVSDTAWFTRTYFDRRKGYAVYIFHG